MAEQLVRKSAATSCVSHRASPKEHLKFKALGIGKVTIFFLEESSLGFLCKLWLT